MKDIPWGKSVQLIKDYDLDKDSLWARNGRVDNPIGTRIIPKGVIGIVAEGPYSRGVYDYANEWPVQFALSNIPMITGTPIEILEIME